MWWDVLRTGFILMLPGASQWRLQISACSAIGCLSVTSAMEISTLLTQLPASSLEPYLILAVTRLKSMDSGRCRLAEAIPTQGRRTSCSLRLARTMNRMGCWASLVQSPPNSAETPNKPLLQVAKPARWLSANERPLLGYIDANGFVFAPNFLRPLNFIVPATTPGWRPAKEWPRSTELMRTETASRASRTDIFKAQTLFPPIPQDPLALRAC